MMMRFTFYILLNILFLSSCTAPITKQLKGTWAMKKVYDNSTDVTAQHNPQNDRWIVFAKDGSFKSGGISTGENTGKWQYTATNNQLFLDSDVGEDDDSYWLIQIEKDSMNWAGLRSSFAERFKLTFSKR